jgi:hypothetical protein
LSRDFRRRVGRGRDYREINSWYNLAIFLTLFFRGVLYFRSGRAAVFAGIGAAKFRGTGPAEFRGIGSAEFRGIAAAEFRGIAFF